MVNSVINSVIECEDSPMCPRGDFYLNQLNCLLEYVILLKYDFALIIPAEKGCSLILNWHIGYPNVSMFNSLLKIYSAYT